MAKGTAKGRVPARKIALGGMLSALAAILMFWEISVPIIPAFIKLDFSDLPALFGAYALGPVWGILICLVKNILHMPFSNSNFVGELSNFLLGACFVIPAGLIYKKRPTVSGVVIGGIAGAAVSALMCLPINYYITYPVYAVLFLPMDAIIGMYQVINSSVTGLWDALLKFNLPFTFGKLLISVIACTAVYRPMKRIIK